MNLQKLTLLYITALTTANTAAHGTSPDWCAEGLCHSFADSMGYGLFNLGWWGTLIGLAAWTLAILGLLFLMLKRQPTNKENN